MLNKVPPMGEECIVLKGEVDHAHANASKFQDRSGSSVCGSLSSSLSFCRRIGLRSESERSRQERATSLRQRTDGRCPFHRRIRVRGRGDLQELS